MADMPNGAPSGLKWAVWAVATALGLGVGGFAASSAIEGKAELAAREAVKPVEARVATLEGANGLGAINTKLDALVQTINSVQSDVRVLGQRMDDTDSAKARK
jgi:hypothetical protein